nr:hypothetical protein [Acidobacteriota bacterium]
DRINFQLKFTEEQGGGSAAGSAGSLDFKRDDYAVLVGKVQVHYQDIDLQAERVEIDLRTKRMTAQGDIILDQGPRRLTGNSLDFDLNSKTGKVLEGTAYIAPDYFFAGTEIDKTGDDTYTIIDGIFTSCSQRTPDWSIGLGRAEAEVEGYAHIHRATFRVRKLPVLFLPYMLYPVKKDRASGFLMPALRFSGFRGPSVGIAYFQTLGRSYDTTFHFDPYFTKGYIGAGNEFRYRPTEGTRGDLLAYAVRDPLDHNSWRYKINYDHVSEGQDLPWGMRAVVHFQDYSDFNFFRDFERNFDINSLRFFDDRAFVTGNWGPHLFNFLINDRKTFVNLGSRLNDNVDLRQLPELQYQLRSTRIGPTPFYLEVQSTLDYLQIKRPNSYSGSYGRFDLFPQLTLPIQSFPWLSLSVTGGERLTYYGDTLDKATSTVFTRQNLLRTLPFGSAEIVGPSVSKTFNADLLGFVKFRHVIEPRITYTYLGGFKDPERIPLFDQVDPLLPSNSVRVALDNRLLGKPEGKNGQEGSAREILLFELSTTYSFDPKQPLQFSTDNTIKSARGPVEALLRFSPGLRSSLQVQVDYNTLFKTLQSTQVSGNLSFLQNDFVGLTWFVNRLPGFVNTVGLTPGGGTFGSTTTTTTGDQIRLSTVLTIVPNRLNVQGQINYDLQQHLLQQQDYVVDWLRQCWGLRMELRRFRTTNGSDREVLLSLTLKNIGTILDINNRSYTPGYY